MNEENVKYLKDSLFYMGFGESLHEPLERAMKEGKETFHLRFSNEHETPASLKEDNLTPDIIFYELNFKKGKENDRYFFNSYKAQLISPGKDERTQLFYINKNKGITTKEAYNLLSGRAVNKDLVNKEGESYNAWLQLNFDQKDKNDNYKMNVYHENYGYDLSAALDKLPVKNTDNRLSEWLEKSLKKGNLHQVILSENGQEQKCYITADPKFKSISQFDENGKPVFNKKKEQQAAVNNSKEIKTAPEGKIVQVKESNLPARIKQIKKEMAKKSPRIRKSVSAKGQGIRK